MCVYEMQEKSEEVLVQREEHVETRKRHTRNGYEGD